MYVIYCFVGSGAISMAESDLDVVVRWIGSTVRDANGIRLSEGCAKYLHVRHGSASWRDGL